jgi:Carboxypeptidase regulatory-like domain
MTVQRRVSQLGFGLVLLVLVSLPGIQGTAAAQEAAVTGVVRDVQGIAQAGALVEVLAAGLDMPKTAFTDLHGRYSISNLPPGTYAVQASAALFVSSTKDNLQLRPGKWAVVNLTLASLFDTSGWLPVERRKSDALGDDWKWTLRSSANRPMLRMVDDGQGGVSVEMSSSAAGIASEKGASRPQVREQLTSGDGGFNYGGSHDVLAENVDMGGGALAVMRLDIGMANDVPGGAPSTEVDLGFGRQLGFAGAVRTVASFQNNPAIVAPGGIAGMSAMQMASAQQMAFGDIVRVEVGGEVYAVRTAGVSIGTAPFVRVMFSPTGESGNWTIGYRMATSQSLQGYDDLNAMQREVPVAMATADGVQLEHGRHQEISVLRKVGRGTVSVAVYHDDLDHPAVAGGGVSPAFGGGPAAGFVGVPQTTFLTDASDGNFRFLGPGYISNGMNLQITQPLSKGMWAALEYSTGMALTGMAAAGVVAGPGDPTLRSIASEAATFAIRGRLIRSGTKLRAAYRWQPTGLLTAVDPYRPFSDQAYLSVSAWQPIHFGRLLPPGLEGRVDITNLLAQGYRPFLSADGQTLYLAQAPRTLEAGLCVTF